MTWPLVNITLWLKLINKPSKLYCLIINNLSVNLF